MFAFPLNEPEVRGKNELVERQASHQSFQFLGLRCQPSDLWSTSLNDNEVSGLVFWQKNFGRKCFSSFILSYIIFLAKRHRILYFLFGADLIEGWPQGQGLLEYSQAWFENVQYRHEIVPGANKTR